MDTNKLREILEKHKLWCESKDGGLRADNQIDRNKYSPGRFDFAGLN